MKFQPNPNTDFITEKNFLSEIEKVSKILDEYAYQGYFLTFDGLKIRYRFYLVENAKASIVIVHGFTEFIQKYDETVWYFINKGYNVFIYDQRGHGISDREVDDYRLTHVNDFDDYVKDLEHFISEIAEKNSSSLPLYIFAHSMGCAVASLYLMNNNEKIELAILSSPMIIPTTQGFPPFVIRYICKKYAKESSWKSKFKRSKEFKADPSLFLDKNLSFNRSKRNLFIHISDKKYQNSYGTNRWIYESVSVYKRLLNLNLSSKIKTKTLILSAENDTVVKTKAQRRFYKLLPNAEFVTIKNAKHSIFMCNDGIIKEYYSHVFKFLSN